MSSVNVHFKREAKLLMLVPAALIVLGLLAAVFGPTLLARQATAKCEAEGGKYEPKTDTCNPGSAK